MSEQPATTSRVKAGFCGSPASPMFSILAERFDLWLAEVKADAWDEGFTRGFYDVLAGGDRDPSESPARNPYRKEADQ